MSLSELRKNAQKIVDVAIYSIGPIFIGLAIVLILACIAAYFMIIFPERHPSLSIGWILDGIFSIYMIYCIGFHYYMAIMTPPGGSLDKRMGAIVGRKNDEIEGGEEEEGLLGMEEGMVRKPCKKCNLPKPERAHHCSVCNACVLKYDHHCPWIHNCVGHFNHRYFMLFITYMVLSSAYFVWSGWGVFISSLDFIKPWAYSYPRALLAFSIILAMAMGVALAALGGWHYYLVMTGQTTVECYNNEYSRRNARNSGETFVNPYDFGVRGNLRRFFSISPQYPWYTLFFPIPVPPLGNGKSWEKSEIWWLNNRSRQVHGSPSREEERQQHEMSDRSI
ncbi:uncharacterized protein VTP21DRAFT_8903 [Calcarisporiella thermophila]|uniref:uncharacterized protein n=1 Tax=Calcarisporiella thermophila TaxID=911321 RepID=UPI0037427546